MKPSDAKKMKRIVSLVLALIVVAGALFGAISSIVAYAAVKLDGSTPSSQSCLMVDTAYFVDGEGNVVANAVAKKNYKLVVNINAASEYKLSDIEIINVTLNSYNFSSNLKDEEGNIIETFSESSSSVTISKGKQFTLDKTYFIEYNDALELDVTYTINGLEVTDEIVGVVKGVYPQNSNATNMNSSSANTSASTNTDSDDRTSYGGTTSPGDAEDSITTPKVIITGFEIPDVVNPGDEFPVTITFMNNSKTKTLENLSMTVTPSDGTSIYNGTNKRHYITIPKRQTTSETFMLRASEELKSEAVSLTVKFEYQYKMDDVYKEASSEEILSIHSIPKEESSSSSNSGTEGEISSFEILSVIPPTDIYPGEDAYVTVRVINKDHQYDASNVQLTVTGEGMVNSGATEYHGALAHSSQAEIEMAMQFDKAGTYTLEAIVTYEDSTGFDEDKKPIVRINNLNKQFTVTVQEQPQMDMGMEMGGMGGMVGPNGEPLDENGMPVGGPPQGLSTLHIALIAGGGIVVLIVAILIVRRVLKKKAEAEDEDI